MVFSLEKATKELEKQIGIISRNKNRRDMTIQMGLNENLVDEKTARKQSSENSIRGIKKELEAQEAFLKSAEQSVLGLGTEDLAKTEGEIEKSKNRIIELTIELQQAQMQAKKDLVEDTKVSYEEQTRITEDSLTVIANKLEESYRNQEISL